MKLSAWAVLAVLIAPACEAAVFRVGNGFLCTHARLGDAIAAAAANGPASDDIRVARTHNELLAGPYSISDQSLRIMGGFTSCTSSAPSGTTLLRSSGAGSIFRVGSPQSRGSVVEIAGFDLDGGNVGSANGGALSVSGRVQVTLRDSRLARLRASKGGAIHIDDLGLAYAPSVNLSNLVVESSTATQEGGGLYCQGRGSITLQPNVTFRTNNADRGGAAALRGCAWYQLGGTLSDNRASEGGAIYAADRAFVYLAWGLLNGAPVAPQISNNQASFWGGGFFLTGNQTLLDGHGVQIRGNSVQSSSTSAEGAALLAGWGAGAWLQGDSKCNFPYGYGCSRIAGNRASAAASGGLVSIVEARASGFITIKRTDIEDNSAEAPGSRASAIVSSSEAIPQTSILISNSTLLGNTADVLLRATEWMSTNGSAYRGEVKAKLVTAKRNNVGAIVGSRFSGDRSLITLAASALDEDEALLLNAPTADSVFDCLISRAPLGVAATRSLVMNPNLDYLGMPYPNSPAVDYCSSENLPTNETDVRGNARPLRHPDVFDYYGTMDVGAYEVVPTILVIGPSG